MTQAEEDVFSEATGALSRTELTEIIALAVRAGQLLMDNGAESRRVEETIRIIGTGLGCDWSNVLVSHNAIMVTYTSGDDFRTKLRRTQRGGVNMTLVEQISHMTHRIEEGAHDRHWVRSELARIEAKPRLYNRWVTVGAVGLACVAFSHLFGGDWPVAGVTFAAATLALLVRQELMRHNFNPLLVVVAAAFTAGIIVELSYTLLTFSLHPETALAASVLFLVPGVPFINAVEDLLKGYTVTGLARIATALLITLGIALGLLLAIRLTGGVGL
jgi:uncharacterized membrane protein YjjP (DUF1212 family)